MEPAGPIETASLLLPLHRELVALLRGLSPEDWERPTIAGKWRVRDIAAHLLDSSLRRLSVQRDGHALRPDGPIEGYRDLVAYLNALNADWVRVASRFSPRVLVELLEVSGPAVAELLSSLPPGGRAIFSVAWAGEETSENWLDVGREYTEWWHHQAQIRDAVGAPALSGRRFLHPVLELSLYAVPVALGGTSAKEGAAVVVEIAGEAGGTWSLLSSGEAWKLWRGAAEKPALTARLDADAAWRLFFNALSPEEARASIALEGDESLAARFLETRGVMV